MELPKRKSPRLSGYDYSQPNVYFLTLCTRDCIAAIPDLYPGVAVDRFAVMPNHIHLILLLNPGAAVSVSTIVRSLKARITRAYRLRRPGGELWQRSFYDRVIRNDRDYLTTWKYVDDNPRKWELDRYYTP